MQIGVRRMRVVVATAILAVALVAPTAGAQVDKYTIIPWCPNASDCTQGIQSALDNKDFDTVRLTARGSPWIVTPLFLRRSNVRLIVELGATLLAKRWAFHGKGDSLLTVDSAENCSLVGAGALRMWRGDYNNTANYSHAEWRMGLNLRGVRNFLVEDVTIELTGGDGIYVTGSMSGDRSKLTFWNSVNVTVRRVRSRQNYRQGMSVIGVVGLNVTDTVFEDTAGTPPMAGVDFEPDFQEQSLRAMSFDNVRFANNQGCGVVMSSHAFNESSAPIELTVRNSVVIGNRATIGGIAHAVPTLVPGGGVIFDNVIVTGQAGPGVYVIAKPTGPGASFTLRNSFVANNTLANRPGWYGIEVHSHASDAGFVNVTVADTHGADFLAVFGSVGGAKRNVSGSFTVRAPKCPYAAPAGCNISVDCVPPM